MNEGRKEGGEKSLGLLLRKEGQRRERKCVCLLIWLVGYGGFWLDMFFFVLCGLYYSRTIKSMHGKGRITFVRDKFVVAPSCSINVCHFES